MAALLLGIFIYDFTPALNLARIANGDAWLTKWFCSLASKSWPDAAAAKAIRGKPYATAADQQAAANAKMKSIITRSACLCLLAALALAGAAVVVASRHHSI